jgi:hypothetical protein
MESRQRRRRSTSTGAVEQKLGHDPSSGSSNETQLSAPVDARPTRPGRRAIASDRGCRVNPAWRVAAAEISNQPAVSALGVTAERDGWGQLIVAVGDIHTAESFPDSVDTEQRSKPIPRPVSRLPGRKSSLKLPRPPR